MAKSVLRVEEQLQSLWRLGGLTWWELAKRAWRDLNRNDLIDRAYELAYNFLLAVFPMLLFLLSLLGMLAVEGTRLRSDLFYYFQLLMPPSAYELVVATVREITKKATGGKLTFGLVFALYAGSSAVTQLVSTLNAAYEVREERSWIKVHLISLALTLAISFLIVAALALVLAGGQIVTLLSHQVGWSFGVSVAIKILQWVLALSFVLTAFAVIYYFAPNVDEQHWYWITPGSLVGVALWALASTGLRAYLHFANTYSRTYGSLGAVILMLWFYVTGLAILIGGQLNATIEHAAAERGLVEAKLHGEKAA